VAIGGLVSSTALTPLLVPVVYGFFEGKGYQTWKTGESAAPSNTFDLDLQPVRTLV
jgi:hypothetical protein